MEYLQKAIFEVFFLKTKRSFFLILYLIILGKHFLFEKNGGLTVRN